MSHGATWQVDLSATDHIITLGVAGTGVEFVKVEGIHAPLYPWDLEWPF